MIWAQSRLSELLPDQQAEATVCGDAVRAYISENPGARAIDIVSALGCTEAQALSALSDTSWELPAAHLPRVLAEVSAWERVLILVRNQDAVAEVDVPGNGGRLRGDWLNWIDERYNLHIRVAATQCILVLIRRGKRGPTYSFNLVNQTGQVFCRFYTRSQASRESLLSFCESYPAQRV